MVHKNIQSDTQCVAIIVDGEFAVEIIVRWAGKDKNTAYIAVDFKPCAANDKIAQKFPNLYNAGGSMQKPEKAAGWGYDKVAVGLASIIRAATSYADEFLSRLDASNNYDVIRKFYGYVLPECKIQMLKFGNCPH